MMRTVPGGFRETLLALAGVLLLAGCGSSTTGGDADAAPLRVLFVGNSLTATNDLPARVASLAAAAGRRVEAESVAVGGFSLEDHWRQGDARSLLATRAFDVIVLQQGPSTLPESRTHLRTWVGRFAAAARAAGTRPAVLGVWPESSRRSALGRAIESYAAAARSARAQLLPAGAAWRAAWACDRRTPLYGDDGFHPSVLGTYAAALVVFGGLLHAPLLDERLSERESPARTSRLLQSAAATALGRPLEEGRRCG
jgi:lysophospholipase L1-like esterase